MYQVVCDKQLTSVSVNVILVRLTVFINPFTILYNAEIRFSLTQFSFITFYFEIKSAHFQGNLQAVIRCLKTDGL